MRQHLILLFSGAIALGFAGFRHQAGNREAPIIGRNCRLMPNLAVQCRCSNLRTNKEENAMSGWAWMAIGATVLAVVIMQIAMRIK